MIVCFGSKALSKIQFAFLLPGPSKEKREFGQLRGIHIFFVHLQIFISHVFRSSLSTFLYLGRPSVNSGLVKINNVFKYTQ